MTAAIWFWILYVISLVFLGGWYWRNRLGRLRCADQMKAAVSEVSVMTDAEREAQIRKMLVGGTQRDLIRADHIRLLLRLLDEARAEIAHYKSLHEFWEYAQQLHLLTDEPPEDFAEIEEKYGPEADVMERAWKALDRGPPPELNLYREDWQRAEDVARALTEYGDQRARAAHTAAGDEASRIAAGFGQDHTRPLDARAVSYQIRDAIRRHFGSLVATPLLPAGGKSCVALAEQETNDCNRVEPTETLPDGSRFRQQDAG